MTTTVAKKTDKLPWGVEVELTNGRYIYLAVGGIVTTDDNIELVISESSSINLPRTSVKKLLIVVSDDNT